MTRIDQTSPLSDGRALSLAMRHAALEAAIRAEQARPAPDMAALQRLKRTRLRVKQELHHMGSRHVPNPSSQDKRKGSADAPE